MTAPDPSGATEARRNTMVWYRGTALVLACTFAAVGLLFLFVPGEVLDFFNRLSVAAGLAPSAVEGVDLYLVLAVAYMYLVTLMAWGMYRAPENRTYPVLLVNAKLASALLSLLFFGLVERTLLFLLNGLIDGLIGTGVLLFHLRGRGQR